MSREDMLGRVTRKLLDLPEGVLRVLYDFLEKLGGENRKEWFFAFKMFLRKENPWGVVEGLLEPLKVVASNVRVITETFAKDSFFGEKGTTVLHLTDKFMTWVLPVIPEEVPAFRGTVRILELQVDWLDAELSLELGPTELFTPAEFAAIVKYFISRQPRGEDGVLKVNGCPTIFRVGLGDGREVNIEVRWLIREHVWDLYASGALGDWHSFGCRVISR